MVIAVGIDIVEVARIVKAMENPRFVDRVLTKMEQEFCLKPYQVAGRWAAKEAVAKAVGLHLSWHEVEILPNETGAPRASIRSVHFDPGRLRIHVSISHERTHAVGMAVLERIVYQAPAP